MPYPRSTISEGRRDPGQDHHHRQRGIRTVYDAAKIIALGADGICLGTLDMVSLECLRCHNCESGRGCARGIATTDPELTKLITQDWGTQRSSMPMPPG